MQPLLRQFVTHQDAPKTDIPPMLVSWQLRSVGVYTDTSAPKRGGFPYLDILVVAGDPAVNQPRWLRVIHQFFASGDTGGGLY